jgi:hypothetical protein
MVELKTQTEIDAMAASAVVAEAGAPVPAPG